MFIGIFTTHDDPFGRMIFILELSELTFLAIIG